jgi:hypothetical protein
MLEIQNLEPATQVEAWRAQAEELVPRAVNVVGQRKNPLAEPAGREAEASLSRIPRCAGHVVGMTVEGNEFRDTMGESPSSVERLCCRDRFDAASCRIPSRLDFWPLRFASLAAAGFFVAFSGLTPSLCPIRSGNRPCSRPDEFPATPLRVGPSGRARRARSGSEPSHSLRVTWFC